MGKQTNARAAKDAPGRRRKWRLGWAVKRGGKRATVSWDASCSLGGIHLGGRLRDVSDGGAFFEPQTDRSQPGLLEEIERRPLLEREDTLLMTFDSAEKGAVNTVATVRWLGPSDRHGCYGLGLQFTDE